MNTKKERREAAQKRARKKRIAIIATLATCVVLFIVAAVVYTVTRPDSRVFQVAGGQSVILYENGRFSANLFHNMSISGTFTEDVGEDASVISFTHGGTTIFTQIEDDVLILPVPWRSNCRTHSHEIEFPLVQ